MEKVRWLDLDDMPETAKLEALCFSSFWTADQFAQSWKQDWFAGYGLFRENRLLGYITLSVLAEEVEVLNIALRQEERGRGLSWPLMSFALNDTLAGHHLQRKGVLAQGWKNGFLEVRVGNLPARALYRSLGFTEAGLRRRYYADGENALVMTVTAEDFCRCLSRRTEGRGAEPKKP